MNKEKAKVWRRTHQQKIKKQVMGHYGNSCKCCGESNLVFLVIDHINGGGNKEHDIVGHGTQFYRWLIKNNYPSGYQVLYHNCNFSKRMGECPHVIGIGMWVSG